MKKQRKFIKSLIYDFFNQQIAAKLFDCDMETEKINAASMAENTPSVPSPLAPHRWNSPDS